MCPSIAKAVSLSSRTAWIPGGSFRPLRFLDGGESRADVMRREKFLQVRLTVFAEAQRLTATFAPGHVGRATGFEIQFIPRVGAQFPAKERVLVETAGQNLFEMRHLPKPPPLVILL